MTRTKIIAAMVAGTAMLVSCALIRVLLPGDWLSSARAASAPTPGARYAACMAADTSIADKGRCGDDYVKAAADAALNTAWKRALAAAVEADKATKYGAAGRKV